MYYLSKALIDAKRNLSYCSVCGNITDVDPCHICTDKQRDHSIICVVQDTKDVIAMEKCVTTTVCTMYFKEQFHQWMVLVQKTLMLLLC